MVAHEIKTKEQAGAGLWHIVYWCGKEDKATYLSNTTPIPSENVAPCPECEKVKRNPTPTNGG